MSKLFRRDAWNNLMDWKGNSLRKPLVLRGARQVGKTTLVKEFSTSYDQSIFLNLEKDLDRNLFAKHDEVTDIIDVLTLRYSLGSIKDKSTLLFIDEIQESAAAIKQLRYFYEELPELHVIAAGSLLEHTLGKVKNMPVGRINYLYLFPLNFQEYLSATGRERMRSELTRIPVKKHLNSLILEAFNRFVIFGGMPEIVQHLVLENGSPASLESIYESIWLTYKDDIEKYASSENMREVIRYILDSAPKLVDKRIKFHNFGGSNFRSREVSNAFDNLDKAKIIQLIHPTTNTEIPLLPDKKKWPRMQFLDTGIINFELDIQHELIGLEDLNNTYRGAIVPHMIFQELISMNKTSYKKPYFWVRDKSQSSAEIDLLLQHEGRIIPVEIKSGKTGTMKSLHYFMDKVPHHYAIRLYSGEYNVHKSRTPKGKEFLLMNLPYYVGTVLYDYLDYFTNNY